MDSNAKDYHAIPDNAKLDIAPPGSIPINIDLAKNMYDDGTGIFIDARDSDEFNEGHISGALNIPYDNILDFEYEELFDSLAIPIMVKTDIDSGDDWIEKFLVVYCSGGGCSLSEDWAYSMSTSTFFHEDITIFYFEEGYAVWKELDYPVKFVDLDNSKQNIGFEKSFFNFIDYLVFISFLLIFIFYFNNFYQQLIPVISRMILGFIFIYFSWDKILDPKLFADVIQNYDIVPFGFENLIALFLPYIEFLIGVFLILGVFIDISAIISISLLIMFVLMIGQAYLRGKSIDCGCLLSDLSDSSSYEKRTYMLKRIVQDICFIVYAIIVKYRTRFNRDK
jgi:rhodanese-related sulfurtransferase